MDAAAGSRRLWSNSTFPPAGGSGEDYSNPAGSPSAPAIAKPATAGDLEVTFLNPHYDCQQTEWQYTGDDNEHHPLGLSVVSG